jgi:hypothetical protein
MVIKERSVAIQAAQEAVENIRDMAFADILDLGTTFYTTGMDDLKDAAGVITVDSPSGADDIRRVTATVSWTSARGNTAESSVVTYVTHGGINKQ